MRIKMGNLRNLGSILAGTMVLAAVIFSVMSSFQSVSAQIPSNSIFLPLVMDTRPNIFGIAINQINDANGLAQIISANADWVRRDFPWSSVEPVEGVRNWGSVNLLEQEFMEAFNRNVQVVGIIGNTPGWALYPGLNCEGKVKADKFSALASFAADVVRRYSQGPYKVQYWELWNEPDAAGLLGCWGDPADTNYYGGSYYGEMLKVVYPAMKAANPDVKVMVGGLLLGCDPLNPPVGTKCTDSRFLEGILVSGAGNYFDGVSFHAYDYSGTLTANPALVGQYSNANWSTAWNTTGPVTLKKAAYLRGLLSRFGVPNKFLMNTEIAVVCGAIGRDDCAGIQEAEETKAYYVVQALAASLADGYVASIWYSATGGRGNGLLNPDLTPLPSYYSYQFTATKLGLAIFVKKPPLPSGVMGYEFTRGGKTIWVVWATGSSKLVGLPMLPSAVYRFGADGQAVSESPATSITVGIAPMIIEF